MRILAKICGAAFFLILFHTFIFASSFFLLNSSISKIYFAEIIDRETGEGKFTLENLFVSPVLNRIDALGVSFAHPDGAEMLRAGRFSASIELFSMKGGLSIRLKEITLSDYFVLLDFEKNGHLRLVDCFKKPSGPEEPPKPPERFSLDITGAEFTNGRIVLNQKFLDRLPETVSIEAGRANLGRFFLDTLFPSITLKIEGMDGDSLAVNGENISHSSIIFALEANPLELSLKEMIIRYGRPGAPETVITGAGKGELKKGKGLQVSYPVEIRLSGAGATRIYFDLFNLKEYNLITGE
ncbi:MAG: hypothetical protein FJ088_00700 [Deltaproteobacteria bacterium]|nr:hypothetical protein [Deltaproteobacteria bacterium]